MARITLELATDQDAVWHWELLKRLGYHAQQIEVVFGHGHPVPNRPTVSPKLPVPEAESQTQSRRHHECFLQKAIERFAKKKPRLTDQNPTL